MESNEPSDARSTDDGDGGTDEPDGSDDAVTVPGESLESTEVDEPADEPADSIPADVPGRPAGTPDEPSTGGTDAVTDAASTGGTTDGVESAVDAHSGEPTPAASQSDLAPDEQYCYSCGAVIKREAVICPACGVSQEQSSSSDTDPGVAALLSAVGFIIPIAAGAGQVYNGQIGKGILFSLVQVVNFFLVFLLIGIVTYPLVGIWAIYDAYQNAQ